MGQKIDLVKALEGAGGEPAGLERIRVGGSEVAMIPFTAEAEEIDLHFCAEPDINDYLACNGAGCVLCRIGRERVTRRLLPVYLPESRSVGVLPVSPSLRPGALWPQLAEALKGETPRAVFVTREQGDKHRVSSAPLAADVDAGDDAIRAFLAEHDAGRSSLGSVYPKIDNDELARIGGIAELLKLKGVRI